MALSTALDGFLANMEYPATKDDLLRESAREGLDADERRLLEALPDQSFSARWHIRYHLAHRALVDAVAPPALAGV